MALTNTETGEYVKIIDVSIEQKRVKYFIFANLEQRQRFEQGLSKYETFFEDAKFDNEEIKLFDYLAPLSDGTKTIKDNLLIAGYAYLKQFEQFNNWIDV